MSLNIDPCYDNIIGITRTQCDCVSVDAEFNISKSGLFLDELDGLNLNMIEPIANCREGSLVDLMVKARIIGVEDMKRDVISGIMSKTRLKRKKFNGAIGDMKYASQKIKLPSNFHGSQMYFADVVGGYTKIFSIGLLFNVSTNLQVFLYQEGKEDPIAAWDMVTQANKVQWNDLPVPIEVDQYANGPENIRYYFIYQPSAGMMAGKIQLNCGCGGNNWKPYWDYSNPTFESAVNKDGHNWADWFMWSGISGSDVNDFTTFKSNFETQGMLFKVETGCRPTSTICYDELDFETNPFAQVMASAVQNRAGAWLMSKMLSSTEPSRFTLVDGVTGDVLQQNFTLEYNTCVSYLVSQMTLPQNINLIGDCFSCLNKSGFIHTMIRN